MLIEIAGIAGASVGLVAAAIGMASAEANHNARIKISELRADLIAARAALEIDPLTGLGNRLALEAELDARRAHGGDWSLALLDLNGFKPINDIHGHDIGDAVLAEVARRLGIGAGEHGLAVRLGGDEFALVMPFAAQVAAVLVERVAELVACPMRLPDGARISIGFAAGITAGASDVEHAELLRRADHAMYRAKRVGEQVSVWTEVDNVVALPSGGRRSIRGGARVSRLAIPAAMGGAA